MGELNLIPYSLRKDSNKKKQYTQVVAAAAILAIIFLAGIIIPEIKYSSAVSTKRDLEEKLKGSENILKQSTDLSKQISDIKSYISETEKATTKKLRPTEELEKIRVKLPSDVTVLSFNYDVTGHIVINGQTKNYNSISEFAANLEESKSYSKIIVNDIQRDANTDIYKFTINISY